MSDLDYISDSDDESRNQILRIDSNKLSNSLLQLSPSKRESTRRKLEEYVNLSFVKNDTVVNTVNDDIIQDSESDSDLDTIALIMRSPKKKKNNVVNDQPLPSIQREPTPDNEKENEHHLQSYLNTTNAYVTFSGRSLRKRNFASTHPYLADQAHYLGLTNRNYLNEVYEENDQNLEHVVKFLNYNYMKLKEKYPKDEKYRSKSFYTIISRQSHIAQQKEREEDSQQKESENKSSQSDEEGNKEFTIDGVNDMNSQNYETDDSGNEIDDSLELFKRHHPVRIVDDSEDSNSDSESNSDSNDSDTYVRVGGKLRREKNALRGVLPESAKRLAIYKSARKRKLPTAKASHEEHRKGVAIKKLSRKRVAEREDFSGFVDDNITYDTNNELYHELYEQPITHEHIPASFPSFESVEQFSGSSSSEAESEHESDLDIFEITPVDTIRTSEEVQDDEPDVFDFDVQEGDYINHMLAPSSHKKSKIKRKTEPGVKSSVPRSYSPRSSITQTRAPRRSPSEILNSNRTPRSYISGNTRPKSKSTTTIKQITSKSSKSRKLGTDSYRKLPVKKISTAKPPSTTHTKRKSKHSNKSKDQPNKIDNYLSKKTRDMFGDDYLFSRNPVLSTTTFEAESITRFVKENYKSVNPSVPQIAPSILFGTQPIFEYGCMLNDINIKKITELGQGKFYQMHKDSVTINILGDSIILTLVDIDGSKTRYEKLLARLAKHFRNEPSIDESFLKTFYSCIKSLLEWNLILQNVPTQREWKLVQILTSNILSSGFMTSSQSKFILPYLLLLQYTMMMISKMHDVEQTFDIIDLATQYWKLFFNSFSFESFEQMNFETGAKSKQAESFFIICELLEDTRSWWSTISRYLQECDPFDFSLLLESVFCLCTLSRKSLSWDPLQILYSKANLETNPEFHYRYLEIIYFMNQRKSWPIDEKIVLQVYSFITHRKFANFPDEIGVPELIGRVSTRLDIPGDSFFERFLQLLYWYISGLSEPSKVKKLVTKLFTFTNYTYQDDQEHYIMFINRLNFILLLASVSTVDLKTQLSNLLVPIKDVKEMKLLKLASKCVTILSEISISRDSKLPIEGITIIVESCVGHYYTGVGVIKIWKNLVNSLNSIFQKPLECVKQSIQFLSLSKILDSHNTPDRISSDICHIFAHICNSLVQIKSSVIPTHNKVISMLNDFIVSLLHKQMGRIPLPSVSEENKVSDMIEILLSIWVQCAFLLNENWERLILQTFPYTGNQQSREQFALFLYANILRFNNLKNCKDVVTRTVLKSLVSFTPSTYITGLMKKLGKEKWEVFLFPKNEEVTTSKLENSKNLVVLNVISNIVKSSKISTDDQRLYIKDILKTLNTEFEKYYSSIKYKTFCIAVVKDIQRICDNSLIDESLIHNLASRLGITENELSYFKIQKLPLRQKLRKFNTELLNALHFVRDYVQVLDKFTLGDGVDLIYHLISIYLQEISYGNSTKWKLVYLLLDYFDRNLKLFKFKIFNFDFIKFLRLLVELPAIKNQGSLGDKFYRIESVRVIGDILKYCKVIFDVPIFRIPIKRYY
ncbi:hypothetical protein G210_0440 [Candida maltosa Xu316]|uniref:Uncharacterized protein n=1 Tax=Candida maltosa (strain Xu316) TaxID=1245528 RepID=M3K0U2_CANMX|nr:hypothetical protein G210_0440 [Candida maltosa Xu316]